MVEKSAIYEAFSSLVLFKLALSGRLFLYLSLEDVDSFILRTPWIFLLEQWYQALLPSLYL